MTAALILAYAGGAVVGLALAGLILFMACALWGADRISFLKATVVALLQYLVVGAVAWGALSLAGGADPADWMAPRTLFAGGAAALAVSLVVLVALLRGVESVPARYGVVIWLFQIVLTALIAALIAAVVFVGLAIYQVTRDPGGREMLVKGGIIFAVVVGILTALILGMSVLRSRPR